VTVISKDLLRSHKGVHIKVSKDVHAELRAKLFKYNLSIQEVMNEFATQFVLGNKDAERIIDTFVKKKLKDQLEGLRNRNRERRIDELDQDALYDLIMEGSTENEF